MSEVAEAEQLAREAFRALREKDYTKAQSHAARAHALLERGGGPDEKRSEVLHRLAGVHRGLGDAKQCEATARAAIEVERRCDRPMLLGNHLMFLADFLFEQKRFSEAADMARSAVPYYERALGPDHSQTARVRADAERFGRGA